MSLSLQAIHNFPLVSPNVEVKLSTSDLQVELEDGTKIYVPELIIGGMGLKVNN